jgi:hypothetical protein
MIIRSLLHVVVVLVVVASFDEDDVLEEIVT